MLVASIGLQTFSEASDFCFTVFMELSASFNDTAVIELLLIKSDINYITKIDSCFKHRFKLGFTVYETSEIVQQLINIAKLFPTI